MRKFWKSGVFVGVAIAAGLVFGCSKKPSKSDCEGAWEHNMKVAMQGNAGPAVDLGKGMYEALKPGFLEACMAQETSAYVDCVNAGKSVGEINACRKKLVAPKAAAAKGDGKTGGKSEGK